MPAVQTWVIAFDRDVDVITFASAADEVISLMQRKYLLVGKYVFHGQYVAEILHAFFLVDYFLLAVGGIQFRFSDTDAELLLAVVTDKNE